MGSNDDTNEGNWSTGSTVPEVVASLYYRYGLLVATHPSRLIIFAIASFFSLCTPLLYLPLPGYLPQEYTTPMHNYSIPEEAPNGGIQLSPSPTPTPLWYQGAPKAYIQQVVIRSTVTPWENDVTVGESLRGPLFTVFRLSQIISDFQWMKNSSTTLGSECLLVEGVVRKLQSSGANLPHYNCLMLSPADLWGRDPQAFLQDPDILRTVKSLKARHEEVTSIADILFGLPSKDIGMSAEPSNPQVINYAITIALKHYSEGFVSALEDALTEKFSLHQPVVFPHPYISHIYFPSRLNLGEFFILLFYSFLFSSIYFSVRKMEGLHSRLGLSISIMATVIVSLCIAVSISAHFGLRPLHTRAKFVYPVLAGLVGFENSMALVRSVLSTPNHLDTKIRMAQGLAKEGWTVTKYFLSMITIGTLSFFLFIPIVQEICIYASLVLLCDLYFQMFFFTAVVSVDLHRCQETDETSRSAHVNPLFRYPSPTLQSSVHLLSQDRQSYDSGTCVPNLHRRHVPTTRGEDRLAPPQSRPQLAEGMPKRLRLTYFMARRRMFQRLFICTFVAWLAWLFYTSEIMDHFTDKANEFHRTRDLSSLIFSLTNRSRYMYSYQPHNVSNADSFSSIFPDDKTKTGDDESTKGKTNTGVKRENLLQHKHYSFARRLSATHWPIMFSYYNISLRGHYISILPPILLSIPISPEDSKVASSFHDRYNAIWNPPTATDSERLEGLKWEEESPFIPSSKGELLATAVLLIPALVVMVYATVALYKCICSRNYAEWRSSWWDNESHQDETSQIIGEAVPLVLAGHPHDVECLCTDGAVVVSSCLAGVIYVWDPSTGECISTIKRCHRRCTLQQKETTHTTSKNDIHFYKRAYSLSDNFTPNNQCYYNQGNKCNSLQKQRANSLTMQPSTSSPSLSCSIPDRTPNTTIPDRTPKSSIPDRTPNSSFPGRIPNTNVPDMTPNSSFPGRIPNTNVPDMTPNSSIPGRIPNTNVPNRTPNSSIPDRPPNSRIPDRTLNITIPDMTPNTNCQPSSLSIPIRKVSSPPYMNSIVSPESADNLCYERLDSNPLRCEPELSPMSSSYTEKYEESCKQCRQHARNHSTGNISFNPLSPHINIPYNSANNRLSDTFSPVWCLECQDGLVYVGTSNGLLEVWDAFSSELKCCHDDGSGIGITAIKLSGNTIIAATLAGSVDILQLKPVCQPGDPSQECSGWTFNLDGPLRLVRRNLIRTHQQPITVLTCDNVRIITGSHDHTLKVLDINGSRLFTLHGHYGPVTSLAMGGPLLTEDAASVGIMVDFGGVSTVIASGAQDGSLCVWDLYTGACVYSVQAHDGAIAALTCTSSYILSLGEDDKLCVWERFQGHLLNTLIMSQMYCSSMVMLTNRLLITSRQGSLTVWDITVGAPVRIVRLGDRDSSVFVRHILPVAGSIVCDYGNQLRVVRLPVAEKID